MIKIAVLVSGGGTNLQALIDAAGRGELHNGVLDVVLSSNPNAFALERAAKADIPFRVIRRRDFPDEALYAEELHQFLEARGIGLIVLAGFMTVLPQSFCKKWAYKMINVHPSLIPAFSGAGYYGLHVHKAALAKGVKVTGATVHFVSEIVDGGAIILQKAVDVLPDDTPESLQKRVMVEAEHILLPKAVSLFCENRLQVVQNHVTIQSEREESSK